MKTFIIGCSKTKKPITAPAVEVYDGPIWKTWRAHSNNERCLALSAKYGLIESSMEISDYDTLLGRDTTPEAIIDLVKSQISRLDLSDEIYVAASKQYSQILRAAGLNFTFIEGGIGDKRKNLRQLITGETK
jgi:hypothetical protein